MRTGAPLCARGRVRALRGLPRAASGAPSSRSAVQPPALESRRPRDVERIPGRPKARGMGAYASLRAAGPSVVRCWRPPVGRPGFAPFGSDDRGPPPSCPGVSGLEPDRPLGSGRGPGASPGPGILDHVVQSPAGLAGDQLPVARGFLDWTAPPVRPSLSQTLGKARGLASRA